MAPRKPIPFEVSTEAPYALALLTEYTHTLDSLPVDLSRNFADLRELDGRDPGVADFGASDPAYQPFYARLVELIRFLLPAYQAEGKSYFSLGLGCTGGRHRSVALVQALAKTLAADGWQVNIRHRDLEPAAGDAAPVEKVGVS